MMITLQRVTKTYETPAGTFAALRDIDLEIREGEFAAIVGKSGSGKSTLLNMLGGIDRPTSGSVTVGGAPIENLTESQLAAWRGKTVGFVFQFFQLLPTLTVAENVMLPMDFARVLPARERRPARSTFSGAWTSPSRPTSCRRPCRAASSSASRSPGRWPTIRP